MAEDRPAQSFGSRLNAEAHKKLLGALGVRHEKPPTEIPKRFEQKIDDPVVIEIDRVCSELETVLQDRGIIRPSKSGDIDYLQGKMVLTERVRSPKAHRDDLFISDRFHEAHPDELLVWPFSERGFEFKLNPSGKGMTFIFVHEKNNVEVIGIVGLGPFGVGDTFGINGGDFGEPIRIADMEHLKSFDKYLRLLEILDNLKEDNKRLGLTKPVVQPVEASDSVLRPPVK